MNETQAAQCQETDSLADIEDIVYKLLFDWSYREQFVIDGAANLSPQIKSVLEPINHLELIRTANKITSNLIHGSGDFEGGLKASYKHTMAFLESRWDNLNDLIQQFQVSAYFAEYSETHFSKSGICIEEAFYLFASQRSDVRNALEGYRYNLLTHEFLTAIFSILVKNNSPGFEIKTLRFRQHKNNKFIMVRHPLGLLNLLEKPIPDTEGAADVIYLYAATSDKLITGPVSEFAAKMLDYSDINELKSSDFYAGIVDEETRLHIERTHADFASLGLVG